MKTPKRDLPKAVASVCAFILIAMMCLGNASNILPQLSALFDGTSDFEGMKAAVIAKDESDALWNKYGFVNVFGLFMKVSGKKEINDCVLLNDGMLSEGASMSQGDVIQTGHFTEYPKFSEYLSRIGTRFIFVAAPWKMDTAGELLPIGLQNVADRQTDSLLGALNQSKVETLDLREKLSSGVEQVERYFYRTDHHWTAEGALVAFQMIMDRLRNDDPSIVASISDPEQWQRNTKDRWFLGSRGKRTGVWCAGVDDLIWYTPRFETNMSCINPHLHMIYKGDFAESNLRQEYLDSRDYFGMNPYSVYVGGNFPYIKHLNPGAPNRRKLLVIQDSYGLPLQAFLSTAFTEVEVIDPRRYTASGIAEYCLWNRPDIVLMMLNANNNRNQYYFAALQTDLAPEPEAWDMEITALLNDYDVTLRETDSNYNYREIPVEIVPDTTYRFSFEALSSAGNDLGGVSVIVYDFNSNAIVRHQIFDVDNSARVGDTQWIFKIRPDEAKDADFALLVYSGVVGNTGGIGMELSGIDVYVLD